MALLTMRLLTVALRPTNTYVGLSTLRSFSRVLWPEVFTNYISAIDQFTVEAFSIVPAECIVGGPFQP